MKPRQKAINITTPQEAVNYINAVLDWEGYANSHRTFIKALEVLLEDYETKCKSLKKIKKLTK